MGRSQIYRGNPEQKHYYLIDNFSGGINTTDVDERVNDFEFRELINVELIEQGKIQNRKGFGELKVLNELIKYSDLLYGNNIFNDGTLNKLYLFKVIDDGNNLLQRLTKYDTLEEFKLYEGNVRTTFVALFVLRVDNTIKIGKMIIDNDEDGDWDYFYKTDADMTFSSNPENFKEIPINGIPSVTIDDKIIINLNDVTSEIESLLEIKVELTGIPGEPADFYYTAISNDSCYMPTPYEVSNVGFNTMFEDPINYISLDTSGVLEIRGSFLTTQQDLSTPISKIPKSGKFTLNLITKGSLFDSDGTYIPTQLKLVSYIIDEFGERKTIPIQYNLVNDNITSAIVRFNVYLSVGNNNNSYINIYKIDTLSTEFKKIYETTTALLAGEKNTGKHLAVQTSVKYFSYYKEASDSPYGYRTITLPEYTCGEVVVDPVDSYNLPLIKFRTRDSGLYVFDGFTFNKYTEYANKKRYAILLNVLTGVYELNVIEFNSQGYPLFQQFNVQQCFSPITLTYTEGLNSITPYIGDIYKIDDEVNPIKYYVYNGGISGSLLDFTETDETVIGDVAFDFTVYVELGDSEVNKINTISLRDIRMIKIKERLVLYGGNTLLFSDVNNLSYFPNYNYVVLPIPMNDNIQKVSYFRGSWIIFTKEFIFRMSGTFGQPDFQVVMINDSIGCVAPDSIRSINNTLIFLSRDGLYVIKQNYYTEGLENVEKVDKNVKNSFEIKADSESLIYNEQYWLLNKENGNLKTTVKQYYNMEYRSKVFPYVIDVYSVSPDNLFQIGGSLYSLKNGLFYQYDLGYTDFLPQDALDSEIADYTYKVTITTPNYMLGAATHDKKFKNIYIKTDSEVSVPIYVTVYLNNLVWKTPYNFAAVVNELGEIEYREILGVSDITTTHDAESNLILDEETTPVETIDPDLTLGSFTLGTTKLGVEKYQVHKVVISGKGKSIALKIEQKLNAYFGIQDIGILYKLGKVKESR